MEFRILLMEINLHHSNNNNCRCNNSKFNNKVILHPRFSYFNQRKLKMTLKSL